MNNRSFLVETANILCGKSFNRKYHRRNFRGRVIDGKMPINDELLSPLVDKKVVLDEGVYFSIAVIQALAKQKNQTIPFLLSGVEMNDIVFFTDFFSQSNKPIKDTAAFSQKIIDHLKEKDEKKNIIMCYGHTHAPLGEFYESFSLGDLAVYVEMKENHPAFKDNDVELMGCLLPPSGDFKFIYYDKQSQDFYRFEEIYYQDIDGRLESLKSFEMKKSIKRR